MNDGRIETACILIHVTQNVAWKQFKVSNVYSKISN